jgi:hypothetical protein
VHVDGTLAAIHVLEHFGSDLQSVEECPSNYVGFTAGVAQMLTTLHRTKSAGSGQVRIFLGLSIQPIKPERVPEAENVSWRIAIEAEA